MDTFSYYFWTRHAAVLTQSSPLSPTAALIRGNRNNCTQFSNNLDWLVSKLERLESSSGTLSVSLALSSETPPSIFLLCASVTRCVHFSRVRAGILEVLHCILIESPEALNIIQRAHIKSIISLLYKHGRNHKVSILRGS